MIIKERMRFRYKKNFHISFCLQIRNKRAYIKVGILLLYVPTPRKERNIKLKAV